MQKVADLRAIIDSIKGHPQHRKIRDLASKAQRAQSCISDLLLAEACCETIVQIASSDLSAVTPVHRQALEDSLIANCIVLYTRATSTHSGGGERGSVTILKSLSNDELTDHKLIVELRNRVIAHVHAGQALGGDVWHREQMFLREEVDGWVPGFATRRIQLSPATLARLRRLIPVATASIRVTFAKRVDALTNALNDVGLHSELIEQHLFDSIAFFGSADAARAGLRPKPGKSAIGIVR